MTDYDHLFKILIIGDSNVGKSSILVRFTDGTFSDKFTTTIGVDYKIRSISIPVDDATKIIKLHIWDTAGQEKFKTITRTYFRGAQGIMIVYDVTNRESFMSVKNWLADIATNGNMEVPKILVGSKCDLEKVVSTEEAKSFAEELNMSFVETSALQNTNIEQAFEVFSREILEKTQQNPQSKEPPRQQLDIQQTKKSKDGCC
ncbi:Rab1a [Hexamita inflata]|uniref:Rab1a n=1 Tax=Hexamita inflata TaxID=28002 RepID=A0AA86PNQ3_9EUKA|nr:Rab1a [Hexamita inflata]